MNEQFNKIDLNRWLKMFEKKVQWRMKEWIDD